MRYGKPEFLAQKSGHIIVTSSAAGTRSVPGNAVYCGTEHFVRAMLNSFRMEAVMEQFYEQAGMTPDVIANAVLYALSQPDRVNVSYLVVRSAMES